MQDITIQDLGLGIDTFNSTGNIADGAHRVLRNVDPEDNGDLSTRKGFQRFYGGLPLRATRITKSGTKISIEFDSSQTISLVTSGQGPIILAGKLPEVTGVTGTGDLKTDFSAVWYPRLELAFKETFSVGDNTITRTAEQTGWTDSLGLVGISQATSSTDASNLMLNPEAVRIDQGDFEIQVDYTSPELFTGYFYHKLITPVTGVTFIKAVTPADGNTIVIESAEHGLNTTAILVSVFEESGGNNVLLNPSIINLDGTGEVAVFLDAPITGYIALISVTPDFQYMASANPGTTSIEIPGVRDPFNFVSVYYTVGASKRSVNPESISWNALTESLTVTYFLEDNAEAVAVYWTPAEFSANIISVEDTTGNTESYVADVPQISAYGIQHTGIYKEDAPEGGWVSHLDSYRSDLEAKVIAGLGGNIFQGLPREEGGLTYLMPSARLTGDSLVLGDNRLAPLFAPTSATYQRTRGLVKDPSINSLGALVTDISFQSDGVQHVTLSFVNKAQDITFGIPPGSEDVFPERQLFVFDKLTLTNVGKSVNRGSFFITAVISDSPTETVLEVLNPSAKNDRSTESGIRGRANVYTDVLRLNLLGPHVKGDDVIFIGSNTTAKVITMDSSLLFLDGITAPRAVPDGINIYTKRTSSVLPLPSVEGFVRGDSVAITGLSRLVTVTNIVPDFASIFMSFTVEDGVATCTLTDHGLNSGQRLLIEQQYDDSPTLKDTPSELTVLSVVSENVFTFTTSLPDGSYPNEYTVIRNCIEVDERLTYTTGPLETLATVAGRWATVEVPESEQDRAVKTQERHFDENPYVAQPYIRSTMAGDSLFFTNGFDEVKKFDGSALYNAGLPPWQAWAYVGVDESSPSLYGGREVEFLSSNIAGRYFVVPTSGIKVGQKVKDEATEAIYTVRLVEADASATDGSVVYRVYVDAALDVTTGSTGTLRLPARYRYYVKVEMVDRNQNIVSAATLGGDDLYVDVYEDATPELKILGLPAFKELDYDRIQIGVYRTTADTVAPFYRTRLLNVDFSNDAGYIVVRDTTPDAAFTAGDLDPTVSVLTGGELGLGWAEPPKAKSITAASNRAILFNVKSPPILDVTFRKADIVAETTPVDYAGGEVIISDEKAVVSNPNTELTFSFEESGDIIITGVEYQDGVIEITTASASPAVGDWVYLFHSTVGVGKLMDGVGHYRVATSPGGGVFTVKAKHSRALGPGTAGDVDRLVFSSSVNLSASQRVPVWIKLDGNYYQDIGRLETTESVVAKRLSVAINTVQAADSPDNGYWTGANLSPVPWLRSRAGRSFADGSMRIVRMDAPSGLISITFKGLSESVQGFVNDLLYVNDDPALSQIRLFPSRLVRSYANFPEIFDDPYGVEGGDSVIDIDPDDGQEGLAVIPFFGSSVFGAAQLTQNVVAFKANSIHLVNIETGEKQRLQTNGQGCTFPRSIAPTRNGIIFANQSGVYRLGWDMQITWVGKMLNGEFTNNVDLSQSDKLAGHNYATGRRYKLSYILTGRDANTDVFVYRHSREEEGKPGSWTIYDNHDATGWANLGDNSYWGSTRGLVLQVRNSGENADYRDEDSPVSDVIIETGGLNFGLPGQRKAISEVTYQFSSDTSITGLSVSADQGLSGSFLPAGSVDLEPGDVSISFSLTDQKGNYTKLRIEKAGVLDERVVISKVSFRVAPIGSGGLLSQYERRTGRTSS